MIRQTTAIKTVGLTKYFGRNSAVRNLTMEIPAGQVTALVGHNGAGKTTFIRMLLGLAEPTRGRCAILGEDSQTLSPQTRSRIGYLAEGHFLWNWMRAKDVARFQRETFPKWDQKLFDSMLSFFGVSPDAKIGQISRGQRAGVSLGMTMATDPEILILDDPSMGLDPVARRALVEGLLAFARREGRTVLISTHLLDDVERLADRIALLSNGNLLVDAPLVDFQQRVQGWKIDSTIVAPPAIPGLIDSRTFDGQTHLVVADPDEETIASIERIGHNARSEQLTLEDAVLAYLRPASMVGSISASLEAAQ